MDCVSEHGELSYKGTIILWSFSYNSFLKFHGKNIWSHNMTVLDYIQIHRFR